MVEITPEMTSFLEEGPVTLTRWVTNEAASGKFLLVVDLLPLAELYTLAVSGSLAVVILGCYARIFTIESVVIIGYSWN